MNRFTRSFSAIATSAALVFASAVAAQSGSVDGEVMKIDKPASRVTLRHGEIRNLDMPAMTMAFKVADNKLLDKLSVGDKVRFSAEKVGGVYTVTALVKRPEAP